MEAKSARFIAWILLAAAAPALSSEPGAHHPAEPGKVVPWSEVQALTNRAAAQRVLPYQSMGSQFWLLPDGALLWLGADEKSAPARAASLGTHLRSGPWLELRLEKFAVNRDALSPDERDHFDAATKAQADAEAKSAGAAADRSQSAGEDVAVDVQKLLVVPHAGGELLLHEQSLLGFAGAWDGKGPLEVSPIAFRVPPSAKPDQYGQFAIPDPMNAGLPAPLHDLLRPETIESRVVRILDSAEALDWKPSWSGLEAEVRVEIDAGERDGLLVGMELEGLPPDEGTDVTIVEIEAERAIATTTVTRFGPSDDVRLPLAGARVATRSDVPGHCGNDATVALEAKVTAVGRTLGSEASDGMNISWTELDIDRGSTQGLRYDDVLYIQSDSADGEGRVRMLGPNAATVIWREISYVDEGEDPKATPPVAGTVLWTSTARSADHAERLASTKKAAKK